MKKGKILLAILALSIVVFLIYCLITIKHKLENQDNDIANIKTNILRQNKNIDDYFKDFPKYYINMDRSKDRRESMEKEIKEYDLRNIKRIKALDGDKITDIIEGDLEGVKYINKINKGTKRELAITLSHLNAIFKAIEDGNSNALFLEDDVEFTLVPHWDVNLENILSQIPADCEVLLLCQNHINNSSDFEITNKNITYNGVAYIVTEKGMEKIKSFKKEEIIYIDNVENHIWDTGILYSLNVYHTSKSLFFPEKINLKSTRSGKTNEFFKSTKSIINKYM